jgi:phospholipase/lecithinase/hemolysin
MSIRAGFYLLGGIVFGLLTQACGDNLGASPDSHLADSHEIAIDAPKGLPKFTHLITFGDSLSDVGTYDVGTVMALGGGKYTVNGLAPGIWVDQLAAKLTLAAPCAAETGLDGMGGFQVAVVDHPTCTNYAQGGARVTNPVGPGNKALGGANATLGQLTVPVVTQVARHLTKAGGSFAADDLVTVLAGANDAFIHLGLVGAAQETPAAALDAMATAGDSLAGYVRTEIVAKGATHVVVVTVPDISLTPFARTQTGPTQQLIQQMTTTFNTHLKDGLTIVAGAVVLADAYAQSADQDSNPSMYGITNGMVPACDLAPAKNPLSSSLVCSGGNVIAGDTSHYLYADGVHPTPFGHGLLVKIVTTAMTAKGWL